MYPPLPFLDRECTVPADEKGYALDPYTDFVIPRGMPVLIPVYAIQRDPKVWEGYFTCDFFWACSPFLVFCRTKQLSTGSIFARKSKKYFAVHVHAVRIGSTQLHWRKVWSVASSHGSYQFLSESSCWAVGKNSAAIAIGAESVAYSVDRWHSFEYDSRSNLLNSLNAEFS